MGHKEVNTIRHSKALCIIAETSTVIYIRSLFHINVVLRNALEN